MANEKKRSSGNAADDYEKTRQWVGHLRHQAHLAQQRNAIKARRQRKRADRRKNSI